MYLSITKRRVNQVRPEPTGRQYVRGKIHNLSYILTDLTLNLFDFNRVHPQKVSSVKRKGDRMSRRQLFLVRGGFCIPGRTKCGQSLNTVLRSNLSPARFFVAQLATVNVNGYLGLHFRKEHLVSLLSKVRQAKPALVRRAPQRREEHSKKARDRGVCLDVQIELQYFMLQK